MLVRSGISVYKAIRSEIPESLPFWPLGLPSWEDTWLVSGWRGQTATWLAVWRREPATDECGAVPRPREQYGADKSTCTVMISHLRGANLHPSPLYPATSDATAAWDAADGQLTFCLPRPNTAVLLRLSADPAAEGRQV